MSSLATTTPKKLTEYLYTDKKGTIIISEGLQNQIDLLHKRVPYRKEWIGMLFFEHISGDVDTPGEFVVEGKHIFLMDIGTEAYTSANLTSEDVLEMYDKVPGAMPGPNGEPGLKYGLIHTHHGMPTFFSGTDKDELQLGAPFYNYYVSLIVNYDGNYCAKVAYIAKVSSTVTKKETFTYKNVNDEEIQTENETTSVEEKQALIIFDLVIQKQVQEELVDSYFQSRFQKIKEISEKPKFTANYGTTYSGTPASTQVTGFAGSGGHTVGSQTSEIRTGKTWEEGRKEENRFALDTGGEDEWREFQQATGEYPSFDWEKRRSDYFEEENEETSKGGKKSESKTTLDPKYIVSLTSSHAKDLVLDWFRKGLDSDAVKLTNEIEFKNINEGLSWFDIYFKKLSLLKSEYFFGVMAKKLVAATSEYSPHIVRKRFLDLFDLYKDRYEIAKDLRNIVDAHVKFSSELLEMRKAAKKSIVKS